MPIGGSASCTRVCSPNQMTMPSLPSREVAAERDHGPHEERRHEGEERRQPEHEAVGPVGQEVLLEDQLHAVGERLQHAERPGLVGPDPVLHAGDDLALEPDHEHRPDEADDEDDDHLDGTMSSGVHSRSPTSSGSRASIGYSRSIRTSVAGAVTSTRSAIVEPGTLNGTRSDPRGHALVGDERQHDGAAGADDPDLRAVGDAEAIEVERVHAGRRRLAPAGRATASSPSRRPGRRACA